MDGDDFRALVEDIRANGQQDVVVLYERMVLDGWHRYRACAEIGAPCRMEEYTGSDAVAFVRSKNQHRRHYQKSQRAAIEVALATWAEAHRPNKGEAASPFSTNKQLAERAGTTERTIIQAKRAHESGLGAAVRDGAISAERAAGIAKEAPELAKQVARGEISIPEAEKRVRPKQPKRELPTIPTSCPDYGEVDQLRDQVEHLQEMLVESQTRDCTPQDREAAKELITELRAEVKTLTAELKACKAVRDMLQNENGELKAQIKRQRREIDKVTGKKTA
jgi:chromosome segregation ATPase